jgi:hypothetical protein
VNLLRHSQPPPAVVIIAQINFIQLQAIKEKSQTRIEPLKVSEGKLTKVKRAIKVRGNFVL